MSVEWTKALDGRGERMEAAIGPIKALVWPGLIDYEPPARARLRARRLASASSSVIVGGHP